jgi:hypothetical protein
MSPWKSKAIRCRVPKESYLVNAAMTGVLAIAGEVVE